MPRKVGESMREWLNALDNNGPLVEEVGAEEAGRMARSLYAIANFEVREVGMKHWGSNAPLFRFAFATGESYPRWKYIGQDKYDGR